MKLYNKFGLILWLIFGVLAIVIFKELGILWVISGYVWEDFVRNKESQKAGDKK